MPNGTPHRDSKIAIDWHIGLMYNLPTMTNQHNNKPWPLPLTTMTRWAASHEMIVLSVPYNERESAKSQCGAQFDGSNSVWFINPLAKWNVGVDTDMVRSVINSCKWFRGFAAPGGISSVSVPYTLPISNYTWLNERISSGMFRASASDFRLYTWRTMDQDGRDRPHTSLMTDSLGKMDNVVRRAFLIHWSQSIYDANKNASNIVLRMTEIDVVGARLEWANLCSSKSGFIGTIPDESVPAVCNFGPEIIKFLERTEKDMENYISNAKDKNTRYNAANAFFPGIKINSNNTNNASTNASTNYAITA
jgi:hypothetical protein